MRFGVGEAAGDLPVEGETALSIGGVASGLSCLRCFGVEEDSTGVPVSS